MSLLTRDSDMTRGPIFSQIVSFSLPLIAGLLFQLLYATVDSIVVGRYVGTNALAAVNGTTSIVNILVGISAGLSTGASVVIAQCFGANDDNSMKLAVHTTIGMTFLIGIFGTLLGILITDPMLALMDTPESVYEDAKTYLVIYFSGMLGLFIYNMGSAILRAVGDSRRPLYFLIFSAVFNIVFDLIFVAVFHWGVAGAAYATIMAEFLSAALVLVVLSREKRVYGLRWRFICLNKNMMKRILKVGVPSALQSAITCMSNVFVQSYINYFDAAAMAAWGCYVKVDHLLYIPIQAISMTVNTFVGQNYGANNPQRARKGVSVSIVICLAVTALLCAFSILSARLVMSLFTKDEEVIRIGVRFLHVLSPFYIVQIFNQIYGSALRGIGKSLITMIISLSCFVACRQIYLFIISRVMNTIITIGLGYPLGWLACSICMAIVYFTCPYFQKKNAGIKPAE